MPTKLSTSSGNRAGPRPFRFPFFSRAAAAAAAARALAYRSYADCVNKSYDTSNPCTELWIRNPMGWGAPSTVQTPYMTLVPMALGVYRTDSSTSPPGGSCPLAGRILTSARAPSSPPPSTVHVYSTGKRLRLRWTTENLTVTPKYVIPRSTNGFEMTQQGVTQHANASRHSWRDPGD